MLVTYSNRMTLSIICNAFFNGVIRNCSIAIAGNLKPRQPQLQHLMTPFHHRVTVNLHRNPKMHFPLLSSLNLIN